MEASFIRDVARPSNSGIGRKLGIDLGCGVGGHLKLLCQWIPNWITIGIDISLDQLSQARNGLPKNGELLRCDLRKQLPFQPNTVNFAYSIYYYYESLLSSEDGVEFLRNVASILTDDGRFVLDIQNYRVYDSRFSTGEVNTIPLPHGVCLAARMEGTTNRSRRLSLLFDVRAGDEVVRIQDEHEMRNIEPESFLYEARLAELKAVEIYGDWRGGAFDYDKSERMIVVFERH